MIALSAIAHWTEPWRTVVGLGALLVGLSALDEARRGRFFRPFPLLSAVIAGWSAVTAWSSLFPAEESLDWYGLALLACAVAPVLGYLLFGNGGGIFRAFVTFLLGLAVAAVAFLMAWEWWGLPVHPALLFAYFVLALAWLPWRRVIRWWRDRRRERQRQHEQAITARAHEEEHLHAAAVAKQQQDLLRRLIDDLRE